MYIIDSMRDNLQCYKVASATLQGSGFDSYDHCLEGLLGEARKSIMEQIPELHAVDVERAELDAVGEALARSPRLARLLLFVGERYLNGQTSELTEYNIATEVFGRSKTTFDAGADSIARVEAHRLRKRLKAYYEQEGIDHPVQISIPAGTYVPIFTRRTVRDPIISPASPESYPPASTPQGLSLAQETLPAPESKRNSEPRGGLKYTRKGWVYGLLSLVLVLAVLGGYEAFRWVRRVPGSSAATKTPPLTLASPPAGDGWASVPLRLMAGYYGSPQVDSAGATWEADRYFHGGGSWHRSGAFIARTSDPLLFQQWRTGDFFYDIPLKPGIYELHLFFLSADSAADNIASFSVGINGNKVLAGFDVNSDSLGENIADERVFRDVSPDKDGYLHLSFTSERGAPALNAIELLPGVAHKQLPIRLVTQATSITDHSGQFWHPDTYYMNGRLSLQRQQIAGSPDPDLFASERYGHFTYAIPVDARGRYTVVLHFAEFYFGPQASGVGGIGNRVFRVLCNGQTLLDEFDVFKEVGSLHAVTKIFYHLKPSAQGKLNLTFEPMMNNATISGIEVLDESQ